jgi:TolA-binding protein
MSLAELHPEHLLDKHARGTLTASERAHLDGHLAKCSSCRFEVETRSDFADELVGEDERISGLVRLVEEATRKSGTAANQVQAPAPTPVTLASRRRSSRLAVFLIAAAAMLVVVGAAASEAGRRVWVPILIHDSAPVAPQTDDLERTAQPTRVVAPPPVQTAVAPVETVTAPIETVAAPVVVAPPKPTPSALLDAESDARRRGDYDRVMQLHAELTAAHPTSHEAQTSRITVARMLLDRGDANGALAGFDAYLANGSGELGEDAMAGRATALERLGRKEDARTAWSALVDKYPDSTYAAHAHARMDALDQR